MTGTASASALRRRPVVRDIDGWAVADLGHLGLAPVRHKMLRKLDPRPPARRLRAAWRTGRLTRALPSLARDMVEQVDRDLAEVPSMDELSNGALLAVLDNGRTALRALHGYEALAGMLVPDTGEGVTAAALALAALAEARAEGVAVDDVVETHPVVLALAPPRIGEAPAPIAAAPVTIDLRDGAPHVVAPPVATSDDAVVREALRLRARWVQELTARAAAELGERLASVGVLPHPDAVRVLEFEELRTATRTRLVPVDLADRVDPRDTPPRALPAQFRLTADGAPVALAAGAGGDVGAGGGIASGPVYVGDDPPAGAVLVVTHLDPRLAPVVPRLAGLVAETGSPLSHLAILAREHGVATVVSHAGAAERYDPGTVVEVDGNAGTVRVLDAGTHAPVRADRDLHREPHGVGGRHHRRPGVPHRGGRRYDRSIFHRRPDRSPTMTRTIRTLLGGVTLAASGAYTFVYLYRWEWNRALMSAAIFIAAEVAVMGSLLAQRLKVVTERLDAAEKRPEARVVRLERIRTAAPPPRKTFAWLAKPEQMNVFVPVLMGAGVLLSGIAWLVERLARATVTPVAERGLAAQLDGLALPAHGFATAEREPLDLLRGPTGAVR